MSFFYFCLSSGHFFNMNFTYFLLKIQKGKKKKDQVVIRWKRLPDGKADAQRWKLKVEPWALWMFYISDLRFRRQWNETLLKTIVHECLNQLTRFNNTCHLSHFLWWVPNPLHCDSQTLKASALSFQRVLYTWIHLVYYSTRRSLRGSLFKKT